MTSFILLDQWPLNYRGHSHFRQFLREELGEIKAVAMDMWDPYIAATKKHAPEAEKKIVFDRFHVMRQILKAVDEVRKSENRYLSEFGVSPLKGTKYLWL